jgi:hypothetical protein
MGTTQQDQVMGSIVSLAMALYHLGVNSDLALGKLIASEDFIESHYTYNY